MFCFRGFTQRAHFLRTEWEDQNLLGRLRGGGSSTSLISLQAFPRVFSHQRRIPLVHYTVMRAACLGPLRKVRQFIQRRREVSGKYNTVRKVIEPKDEGSALNLVTEMPMISSAEFRVEGRGQESYTSASVISLLPAKNGAASFNKGSTSFSTAPTSSPVFCARSSSVPPRSNANTMGTTFVQKVSTKKPTRARNSGAVGELWLAGNRWEGWASARNCAMMADSVRVSSMMPLE